MEADTNLIVRDNLRALLRLKPGQKGVAAVMRLGFSNGTATRLLAGDTSHGTDTIATLAKALNVKPWQMLVPNLDPDRLPSLEPVAFRWPFRNIDAEVVTGLVGTPAQGVENGLLVVLSTLGISPRKRSKAA